MNKKIIILLILNILLFSTIIFLKGYRFFRTSIYKNDLILSESENYEVIYSDKDFSIVSFDGMIKVYNFENELFLTKEHNYGQNNMFEFLNHQDGYYLMPRNLFFSKNERYIAYPINERQWFLKTNEKEINPKYVEVPSGKVVNTSFKTETLSDDMYLVTYTGNTDYFAYHYVSFVDKPSYTLKEVPLETYVNIELEGKVYHEKEIRNILDTLPFSYVESPFFDQDKIEVLLTLESTSFDLISWEKTNYSTTYFKYGKDYYYYYGDRESLEYGTFYMFTTREFEDAFELLKKDFQ